MKNLFKGIAISLAFALSIGAGVVSLAHSSRSETKQTEAAADTWVGLEGTGLVGSYYSTANEAIDNKDSSMTSRGIKLLKDTTENGNMWLNTSNVTIDLNGHTLTIGSSGSPVNRFLGIRDHTALNNVEVNVTLTIKSSVAGGKINGYCADSVLYINPSETGHTAIVNIESGVQIKNFSSGRTVLLHKSATLNVRDGASIIATSNAWPGVVNYGGSISNAGTIQGVNDGVTLQPQTVDSTETTPYLTLTGANALVTPRILSKRSGGVSLNNYSYSENNSSVQPVNIVFDSNVTINDNQQLFTNIHWKYRETFTNYVSITANGSEHHTLTWVQIKANETVYFKWTRNTYTVSYNINGGKSGSTSSQTNISAESSVTLRNNGFTAQDYYSFKEWNTKANGTGASYQPGASYQVLANTVFYAIWYQTDTNIVDQFVGIQLHFDVDVIPVSDQSNTGECLGVGGYYDLAKQVYDEFTNAQKTLFCTGEGYADARARLKAWANANGDDLDLDSHELVTPTPTNILMNDDKQTTNVAVVVTVCSLLTVISLAAFIIARRKRIN